jgi:hypothetical protein
MATASGFIEGMFALSADMAIACTVGSGVVGAVAAALGLYMVKTGDKAIALRLLAMCVVSLFAAWAFYGKYQELIVQANGVATGPIYEAFFLIVLLCLPIALMLGLIFSPSKKGSQ